MHVKEKCALSDLGTGRLQQKVASGGTGMAVGLGPNHCGGGAGRGCQVCCGLAASVLLLLPSDARQCGWAGRKWLGGKEGDCVCKRDPVSVNVAVKDLF